MIIYLNSQIPHHTIYNFQNSETIYNTKVYKAVARGWFYKSRLSVIAATSNRQHIAWQERQRKKKSYDRRVIMWKGAAVFLLATMAIGWHFRYLSYGIYKCYTCEDNKHSRMFIIEIKIAKIVF